MSQRGNRTTLALIKGKIGRKKPIRAYTSIGSQYFHFPLKHHLQKNEEEMETSSSSIA